MLDAAKQPGRVSNAVAFVAMHPWQTVLRLLPLGVAAVLTVDAALGTTAEYYNATHLIRAWLAILSGGSAADAPAFLLNQADLGDPLAMAIGSVLLILEPALVLALVVLPASFLARRPAA